MPQVISYKSTREQVQQALVLTLELADGAQLEGEDRAVLLPVMLGLLVDKPIGMQPDGPALDLGALTRGRH
jgi:hypothetical protein